MRKTRKDFDCIDMKDAIQEDLLKEEKRFGEDEIMNRHRKWLRTSSDPLAAWWRKAAGTCTPGAAENG